MEIQLSIWQVLLLQSFALVSPYLSDYFSSHSPQELVLYKVLIPVLSLLYFLPSATKYLSSYDMCMSTAGWLSSLFLARPLFCSVLLFTYNL